MTTKVKTSKVIDGGVNVEAARKLDFSQEQALEQPLAAPSEMARAVDETGVVCRTHVGGQALIEGIMMRGKYNWALAVRKPDETMHVEEHDLESGKDKNSWMYKPVVRGCTALVESLMLGYKALEIATQYAFEGLEYEENEAKKLAESKAEGEAESDTKVELKTEAKLSVTADAADAADAVAADAADAADTAVAKAAQDTPDNSQDDAPESILPKPVMTATMIMGILLGIGIFVVLPAIVTNLIVGDYGDRTILWNIVDGFLRVAIFVFYIWLIGRMNDIQRMFAYHGAEHKTIHCYEHGLDLTVPNARRFPTLHVRCGTAFMLMTMIIAILVFTLVPVQLLIDGLGVENGVFRLILVIISRIILLPLIAGFSYEVTVKWAGSRPNNPLVRIILWPGMQLQRLTTNEPDDGMLECAIEAMLCVLRREQKEAAEQGKDTNGPNVPAAEGA